MDFEKAIACIRAVGIKPNLDNFDNKLVIQKTIFLLQKKGIDCGVPYNFYVRGPYSPELTKGMYEEQEKLKSLKTSKELSKKEEKSAEEFKEIFEELTPGILEVAATYAYFAFEKKEPAIEALRKVRETKGFYPEAQISQGVSKAKQFLYEPTKKELDEMKKEFKMWENAGINTIK
ncbi:MAG: hypothetical protein NTY48_06300 [Candidatus Diapherotrites archaeon]|nr:hypothetical protein [Candidatus Diapherotrites archaeon]